MPLALSTLNASMVVAVGDQIVILRPPGHLPMSKQVALNLAAWLVALADDDDQFDELLERVRGT